MSRLPDRSGDLGAASWPDPSARRVRRVAVTVAAVASLLGCPAVDPTRPNDGGRDQSVPPRRDARVDRGGLDGGPEPLDARRADAGPPPPVSFVDVAADARVTAVHAETDDYCPMAFSTRDCWTPFFAGGVAIGDVDQDGWPDLYLTALDRPGTLYRNRGDGTFEDITDRVGLLDGVEGPTNGAAFVDVDRDGDLDLYVVSLSDPAVRAGHYLFIQGDDGTFTDEAAVRGAAVTTDTYLGGTSVAVGDYDLDGYPDLHVNEWLAENLQREPHTRLLRNRGAACPGCFEDTTHAAGVATRDQPCLDGDAPCHITSFSSAFVDLDGDRWPELLMARDFGVSRIYWSRGDGTFVDRTRQAGVGTDENGMGSTIGDVDGDGDLDWFVSSIGDTGELCGEEPCVTGSSGNRLYLYRDGRHFDDATDRAGVRHGGWGWGTALFDADNDGDLDLVLTNGIVSDNVAALFHRDPMRFWENRGDGTFDEVAARRGLTETGAGTGLAVFDYDRDGDQDILLVRNGKRPALYRNDGGNARSWLRVRLEATRSAPEGLGARVRVRVTDDSPPLLRLVDSVTHYLGQSERVAQVGLGVGVDRVAEVEVTWPTGEVTRRTDVAARQELVIREQ
ncbi:MAG: CRTAC1 family protein [Sandaracinaceae bacterium]